jgi:UDP-glucose-4-epimerase GalE
MHFAGLAYVGESVVHPEFYYRSNVLGSLSLLEAVREVGIDAFVFSSSCATYGIPLQLPISEAHPQKPINPYGTSKLIVELILRDFGSRYGLRSVSLRYFNAAGADPEGQIGEAHDPETHAAPLAILAALGQGGAFKILGTDYPTTDGSAIRDYVHVCDLADAHIAALRYLLNGGETEFFNLGSGIGTSVRELIASVERVGGRAVPFESCPRRIGDPPVLVADPQRAISLLNWRPRYRELDEIIRTAWTWHRRS